MVNAVHTGIAASSVIVFVSNRYSSVFPSLNMAVKRREQALQEYKRLQTKVEKYEEKERTGAVIAKLHQVSVWLIVTKLCGFCFFSLYRDWSWTFHRANFF